MDELIKNMEAQQMSEEEKRTFLTALVRLYAAVAFETNRISSNGKPKVCTFETIYGKIIIDFNDDGIEIVSDDYRGLTAEIETYLNSLEGVYFDAEGRQDNE